MLQQFKNSVATKSSSTVNTDIATICGQTHGKRALEIAAAGQHSMMFIGPPGSGKTLLAQSLPGLLPDLNEQQAIESATLFSVSHCGFDDKRWKQVPFLQPHHSASSTALVGRGNPPQPGEISLVHHGVLFLDELPEFNRQALEMLRQPMESAKITISRSGRQLTFPANFQFIAAMNPCPCGYLYDTEKNCCCSPEQIKRYHYKLSGPMLDRIDMNVTISRLDTNLLLQENSSNESSAMIKKRVFKARIRQLKRNGQINGMLDDKNIRSQ